MPLPKVKGISEEEMFKVWLTYIASKDAVRGDLLTGFRFRW